MGFMDLFGDIKNRRFIKVGIYFGLRKEDINKGVQDEWFNYFNRLRLEIGKYEKEWGLPSNVNLKITEDLFPSNLMTDEGSLLVPVKGYSRSKEFIMKLNKEGFTITLKPTSIKKLKREQIMVSFLPETDYSPKELAKDILFLQNFGAVLVKKNDMTSFRVTEITKKQNKIVVRTRDNVVEYEYPLEERIKLYYKDKELDKFIFKEDLVKVLHNKDYFVDNKIKEEANKLLAVIS